MRYILGLILILNFFSFVAVAQLPPPPPAPLIYKSPEKKDLQEYTASNKSFKAIFPGTPQVSENKEKISTSISYSVKRMGSLSLVLINEFDVNTEDKLSYVFESVKSGLIKQNLKIENEKDIKIDGIVGKEFSASDALTFQKARIFATGKRIYIILSDVTNWQILNNFHKDKVEEFNNETDRFFNSFKILN